MSMRRSALFFLVAGLAFASMTRADDVDDDEDFDDSKIAGVEIHTIFPESENQEIPTIKAGVPTKALVTFENNAESTFQVEFVTASLATAHDQSQIVQNLTGALVNRKVNQGESVSMLYEFVTDIAPIEYGLAISVYFMSEDDNERAQLTGFNETVVVQDSASVFDVQSLFMTLLIGGAIYAGVQHFNKKSKKVVKRVKAVSASPAPASADAADQYIPKEHLMAVQRKGSPNRKNSPK